MYIFSCRTSKEPGAGFPSTLQNSFIMSHYHHLQATYFVFNNVIFSLVATVITFLVFLFSYQFSSASQNEEPQTGYLLKMPEDGYTGSRHWQVSLSEAALLGLQVAPFSLCLHMLFLLCVYPNILFL